MKKVQFCMLLIQMLFKKCMKFTVYSIKIATRGQWSQKCSIPTHKRLLLSCWHCITTDYSSAFVKLWCIVLEIQVSILQDVVDSTKQKNVSAHIQVQLWRVVLHWDDVGGGHTQQSSSLSHLQTQPKTCDFNIFTSSVFSFCSWFKTRPCHIGWQRH